MQEDILKTKALIHISPSQDSSSSSVNAVMHLHIVKLTHILSLQAEVSETQCDDVTLLNRNVPYTQLMANRGTKD